MNDEAYKHLLAFLMCDDPSGILPWLRNTILFYADLEAARRGYTDWVHAYHEMPT